MTGPSAHATPTPPTVQRSRVGRLLRSEALGSVLAQAARAVGSLLFQLVVAWSLGAAGFGYFAFLFGAMVMAAAVTSGLIGDTLTVLDRHDDRIRSALWKLTGLSVVGSGLIATATGWPFLGAGGALSFGLALMLFMVADLLRRLMMARLAFWRLTAIDSITSLAPIPVFLLLAADQATLSDALLAMAFGTLLTAGAIWFGLPPDERRVGRGRADVRAVLGFGTWRALQQLIRPSMLNAARWLVLIAAGAAAVGGLEAARLIVGPGMLIVQGLGSYLFARYAADRDQPSRVLVGRADRGAAVMLAAAVVVGGIAAAIWPLLAGILGDSFAEVNVLAVLGWACYVASCAAVLPYGTLAAVRGRQRIVFGIRLLDAVVSLALTAAGLLLLDLDAVWMPFLISVGSFLGGILCRHVVLREARDE